MPETVMTVIMVVMGLALLAALIYLAWRQRNPQKDRGKTRTRSAGSGKAVGAMQSFARSNRFKLVAPARLQRGDAVADLDAVVVGYFGVLGVIALGYNGEVYGDADAETWLQVTPEGQRVHFENPINQSSAAVRVIRDALFATKQKRVPVEVVYVFTSPTVQLAVPRSVECMKLKDFKKLLKKDKYLDDCGLEMDQVEAAIRAAVAE